MRYEHEAMMVVRAELCERLESLQALSIKVRPKDFKARVAAIRSLAAAYGLIPVVRLADALERAAGEGGRRPSDLYLQRLGDAIGCERLDEQASQAMMASVAVRLDA